MIRIAVVLGLLVATPALAQQQTDPAFLQRALSAMQQQRNQSLDAMVVSEANRAALAEENAKLKAQVQELEKKIGEPQPKN